MAFFTGWFGTGDDDWFDPGTVVTPPASGEGGVSSSKPLSTIAPRPRALLWRQIAGAVGTALTETRHFLHDMLGRDHLWGNHVRVTFAGAATSVRIDSGLGGPVKGYKIVRADADVRVWDGTSPTPQDPSTERGILYLQASGAATVTLYLY